MKPDPTISKRFGELEQGISKVKQHIWRDDFGQHRVENSSFQEWATNVASLLQRVLREDSIHFKNFESHYSKFEGFDYEFDRLIGIFRAAKSDYEGGYLFKLNSLISAEVVDGILEQAQELLDAKYIGPACVVVGVALETTVKKLCENNSIPHAKLDKMNADLAKAGVYNVGVQKQVTAWAHWRNDAAHGNWNSFTEQDVTDMIKGVQRFIANFL